MAAGSVGRRGRSGLQSALDADHSRDPDATRLRRSLVTVINGAPTYIIALIFSVLILLPHPLHLPLGQVVPLKNWKTIVSNVFMMQGTLSQSVNGDGAVWSLSIEWWCYMLAIVLIRYSVKWTTALIAISFCGLMVYVRAHGLLIDPFPLGIDFALLAWAWMIGFSFYREPTKTNFAIMTLLPLVMFEAGSFLPLASIVVAASSLIVYFSKEIHIKNQTACRALQWLGDMSYPLYLLHAPLLWWISSETSLRNGNVLIVTVLVIVSVAYFCGRAAMMLVGRLVGVTTRKSNQMASLN